MKSFSAIEAIKFGWGVAKKKWHLFFMIGGLNVLINIIPSVPDFIFGKGTTEADTLILILAIPVWILGIIVSAGMIKIQILLGRGDDAKFSDVWVTNFRLLVRFMLTGIVSGLIVLGGLILLIIPGLIFALRLSFAPYFVLDKNMGAIEAVKASWNATKGNLMELLLLGVLCMLVVIAGFLALVVGLIWAVPTVLVASGYVYHKLSTKAS